MVEVGEKPNVAKPGWLRDQRKLWRDGGQVRSDTNEKLTNSQSANTLIWLIWHICKVTHYSFTITIFISLQFGNSPKICLRFNLKIFLPCCSNTCHQRWVLIKVWGTVHTNLYVWNAFEIFEIPAWCMLFKIAFRWKPHLAPASKNAKF